MSKECDKYWQEERPQLLKAHRLKAKERWDQALSPDYDYEFFLKAMKAKLENMADYFETLAPIVDGPYYARQMNLAVKILDIVIEEGGQNDYKEHTYEDPLNPGIFLHYVNMKNAHRFDYTFKMIHFFCDAQRICFNKAWNLFVRILTEQMFNWTD